jgi:hypothetical protein
LHLQQQQQQQQQQYHMSSSTAVAVLIIRVVGCWCRSYSQCLLPLLATVTAATSSARCRPLNHLTKLQKVVPSLCSNLLLLLLLLLLLYHLQQPAVPTHSTAAPPYLRKSFGEGRLKPPVGKQL